MSKCEKFSNELLEISVTEDKDSVNIYWSGKSIERQPSAFITPILIKFLKKCINNNKRMILDFSNIEYMNSSTITPIIKILERAKRSKVGVTVKYIGSLKWQHLIFSALEIFQTKDQRIIIQGNEN
jgi:hypothetical protein